MPFCYKLTVKGQVHRLNEVNVCGLRRWMISCVVVCGVPVKREETV